MTNESSAIVSKVPPLPRSAGLRQTCWNYSSSLFELWRPGAHVLKNAGVGYGDGVEVRAGRAFITGLLFLRHALSSVRLRRKSDEMTGLRFGKVGAASRRSAVRENRGQDASTSFAGLGIDKLAAASLRSAVLKIQRQDAFATIWHHS